MKCADLSRPSLCGTQKCATLPPVSKERNIFNNALHFIKSHLALLQMTQVRTGPLCGPDMTVFSAPLTLCVRVESAGSCGPHRASLPASLKLLCSLLLQDSAPHNLSSLLRLGMELRPECESVTSRNHIDPKVFLLLLRSLGHSLCLCGGRLS